jgi:3-deoxy-7-phosphoheptulonate synthase
MEDLPLTDDALRTVAAARTEAEAIVKGLDDRLIVVVGQCSVHDVNAAKEYAGKLKAYMDSEGVSQDLCVIMRVYFEKPRTTVGWKGMINDPHLDGRCVERSELGPSLRGGRLVLDV